MAELDEWKPKDLSWDLNYTISMIFSESQFRGIQSMKSPHFWPLKWRLASKIAQNDDNFGDILAHRKLLQDIWRNFQMFWSLDLKSFIFESFGYFRLKWELISNLFQENSAHCPSPTCFGGFCCKKSTAEHNSEPFGELRDPWNSMKIISTRSTAVEDVEKFKISPKNSVFSKIEVKLPLVKTEKEQKRCVFSKKHVFLEKKNLNRVLLRKTGNFFLKKVFSH